MSDQVETKTNYLRIIYDKLGLEFRFASFAEWLAELGPKPSPAHSVDRKNNDGHYEPDNVRWATRAEQNKNQRPRKSPRVQSSHSFAKEKR